MRTQDHRGTPQIYHYLRRFQEDPGSRIFAPLAEAYRKAGLLNEALEIAREGCRLHPHFVGGKVALARTLFDLRRYPEVLEALDMVLMDAPDNLVAQKLVAESNLILGKVQHALAAYKTLLFLMPDDPEIPKLVQEIEERAYEEGALVLQSTPTPVKNFAIQDAQSAISGDPEVQRKEWIKRVELLQGLLVRVQRFKLAR
jgi:tetratricopeptide (TPR) repeat protein